MLAPFFAQGVYKAIIFGANSMMASALRRHEDEKMSLGKQAICGSFAGGVNAFVVTPVELVRNRLQVQYESVSSGRTQYRGPWDCVTQIVRSEGLPAMWRGVDATLSRDAPGVALWFLAFQVALSSFPRAEGEKPPPWQVLGAGACGGVGFWVWALPLDTVKVGDTNVIHARNSSNDNHVTLSPPSVELDASRSNQPLQALIRLSEANSRS